MIAKWALGGAILGFVLGFGMCASATFSSTGEGIGQGLFYWFVLTIAGGAAGIAIRKWIFQTFWE